ncbi:MULTISPECIES: dethiobiotin synthase [Gammaproteobacteria]|uniref:dethiobiotin synthase n=1 Tax=Gammaproteobacteria TaxID=1236 RepID=UPI000DCFF797|nr:MULTISPECIES: dethiobiotin synthase [Gammaproteobacteria]RTE87265.1 dethiobiotin synthase [Aliidiomarina sp. B3213]TCZ92948.1 dethiobiotin synthase [Lysobacter sp. N42]
MSDCVFVTGSDTEVGKTRVTSLLLKRYKKLGSIGAWKPISAGAEWVNSRWENDDALSLMKASGERRYKYINPIVFEPAIAPHIAAKEAEFQLDMSLLDDTWKQRETEEKLTLVEGAGGWLLPLNDTQLLSDWVAQKGWGVIVVVGMRLGCLNHALLTVQAIQQSGLPVLGWIANQIEPIGMNRQQENIASLQAIMKERFKVPLLLEVPYLQHEDEEVFWLQNDQQFNVVDRLLKPKI